MKHIPTTRLSLMAMLIALQIVLSKFLMLQLTDSIRLSIDSVPILLGAIWFGPFAGGLIGALADMLGTILFPTAGAYYPPLTIAFLLIGVVAGLLAKWIKTKNALLRTACIVIPAELIGSYLFKSYALSGLIGVPFTALLAARILPVGIIMIVNTMLVTLLNRLFGEKAMHQSILPDSVKQLSVTQAPIQMTYDDAMTYIHHVTWRGSRLGLERTRELLSRIGNPQNKLKFIHIAGTNGKGSTAAMLAKILSHAGYRTGLYISPYINRFNERMQMNGVSITDDELAEITATIRPHAEAMADHPTEFELITVIAFEYFLRQKADIVVLEVGLGGELDSTNVIDTPELAVITNIGLDHTRELGPTIADIARAKAGIIKPGGDVVIYDQNPEADAVFTEAAQAHAAKITITDHSRITNVTPALDALRFDCVPYGALACGLTGTYQAHNAAVVITAVELLQKKSWNISEQNIRDGLLLVRWPARFELLGRNPIFIADGGHNPQGIAAVVESLKQHFPGHPITFLIGIMADKDIPHMIDQLAPIAKEFITVTPDNPRAMDAKELASLLRNSNLSAIACDSVIDGVSLAVSNAGENGVVCALGSLYMLGEVRTALGAK